MKKYIKIGYEKIEDFFLDFKNAINISLKLIYNDFRYCRLKLKKFIKKYSNKTKIFLKFIWGYYFTTNDQRKYIDEIMYDRNDHFIELIKITNLKLKKFKNELILDLDFDERDLNRLNDIIKIGDKLIEMIKEEGLVDKNQEYQKLSKSYFNKLQRIHDKLYSIREFQNKSN